jgi:Mn2+/Fe2+ NRAMP family transporter
MGTHVHGRIYNAIAWVTVAAVVGLSTVYLVVTLLGLVGIGIG